MTQEQFFSRFKYDPDTDLIGGGGYGKVYKAFDETRNRWIAIKVAELKTGQESVSLKKEVELAKALPDHKNVAHYESCDRFKTPFGTFDYGVLQYYPLGNLSKLVRSKKLKPADKENIAKGILSGIHHLHRHNVVHRDLKSANILIAEGYQGEYVPKIADFGLSKHFSEQDKSYFSNSFAGGSLLYVAPEQLAGNREIRKNVDLWSLGVLLYELFTGDVPFKATVDDGSETARAEIIRKIAHADIPPAIRTIPAPWQEIIRRCLVVDPKVRTKSIEEVMTRAGMMAGAGKFDETEPDPPKEILVPDPKPINIKPWLIGAGIGLLLLFGGIWMVNSIQKNDDDITEEATVVVDTTAAVVDTTAPISEESNTKNVPSKSDPPNVVKKESLEEDERRQAEQKKTSVKKPYIRMISIPGRSFSLSETEVTIGQYLAFCKATNSHWPEWLEKGSQYNIYTGSDDYYKRIGMSESNTNHPITGVSAINADAFCAWMGGRLPTESEWEYAAKGGENYEYSGSNDLDEVGWYDGNSGGKARPVRQKSPNAYGLYDMSGNVWEWTSSKEGANRVFRGGGWGSTAKYCRVSFRFNDASGYRDYYIGFRLAL